MIIDIPFIFEVLIELIGVIPLTLFLTFTPLIFGFVIGSLIAWVRIQKTPILNGVATFFVSFFRGTPIIMHIMIVYIGIPLLLYYFQQNYGWNININQIPATVFVIFALSITASAFLSEIIRAGIQGVSKGQIEAALSIGMSSWQCMYRIILPQALAKTIPNMVSLVIGFLHATSIAFLVSVVEITGLGKIIASVNLKFLESYIAAGIIYWALTICIERVGMKIEKRVKVYSTSL